MTLEEVYEFYGTANKAALALGVSRQIFYVWSARGYIPYPQQKKYEKLTNGALKARKNPQKHTYIKKPLSYYPQFKYFSQKHGLCEVYSIIFRKGRSPRIVYIHPESKKQVCTFKNDGLIQAYYHIKDIDRNVLFENDIIHIINTNETVTITNYYDIYKYDLSFERFKIIGNKLTGEKEDGHTGSD